jgi:general secretion pathway protein A
LADEVAPAPGGGSRGVDESVRRLQYFLAANAERGRHAVLVVDEAQLLLDTTALETLRLLVNLEHQSQPLLTLLLVGQPTLLPALERLPALEERLGVKCLLRPLSADETASYVQHRLAAAGARREIFTPEALSLLHRLGRGLPRRINRLCDLALLIGYAEERSELGPDQVEAVAHELATVTPE